MVTDTMQPPQRRAASSAASTTASSKATQNLAASQTAVPIRTDRGGPLNLDQRLALLESRFTTPATANPAMPATGSASGSASFTSASFGRPSATRNHAASNGSMGSLGNSRLSHSQSASQHAYSFSTPMSKPATSSNLSAPSLLPSTSVRSKRKPFQSPALQALNAATERHMRKMASTPATSPFGFQGQPQDQLSKLPMSVLFETNHDHNKSLSALPTPPVSDGSPKSTASNNTLLTSHVHRSSGLGTVQESPPATVSPHHPKAGHPQRMLVKPSAARSLMLGHASSTPSSAKRKSTPKKKQTSLTDKTSGPGNSPARSTGTSFRAKRVRLFSDDASKTKQLSFTPPPQQQQQQDNATVGSETSRDRSHSHSRKSKPPANNKFISDFFSTATGNGVSRKRSSAAISPRPLSAQSSSTATLAATSEGSMPSTAITTTSSSALALQSSRDDRSKAAAENRELKDRMHKMQLQLQEKDEQLKALANNRTILHTALESALNKAKQHLADTERNSKQREGQTSNVIEDLLRWKSAQQAKDLREKLTADGARLGRIVYARAGMRAVESWEEGQATKDLEHKKKELRKQRKRIETMITETPAKGDAEDGALSRLLNVERKEALHMQLETVRRKERQLLDVEHNLNAERAAHYRALKRVASEDSSRFCSRPKLNERYILHSLLGKGGFSEVWRAYDLVELREVAVKIHQLDPRWPDSKKENYTKHVSREYEIHRNVRHSRIVSLYDVFEIDNNSFATVLECCNGTDLDAVLKERRRLPEREARAILLQILAGMQYLSQGSADGSRQGIIHYDLKPGNILFDEAGYVKITDFGLSKIVDTPDPAESMELTSQGAGTYWYLPPECFVTSGNVRISNKVDVWSIGVIFFQMMFGKRPFGEGKTQDTLLTDHTMLNAQNVDFPDKPGISEGAKAFIRQCLTYDQAFRPNIGQVCENEYILKQQAT